ncbi:MAG: NAD(P)H-dependent oxidoreductase [Rhodocyclaceae bacterium]|nr:NAD(P)H-dependent oxidoreductase [Rhodocyclaceae bacterium]
MKAFVVFAHPEPKSFNGALYRTAVDSLRAAGHEVHTSDLYGMQWNPVSDRRNFVTVKDPDYLKLQLEETHASEVGGFAPVIETELQKLEDCDLMIWQFPLWWFGLPAILKGWADRVLAMGRTYGYGKIYDTGAFRGKRAVLSLTTGGPAEAYRPDGFNGDIMGILRPVHRGILQFVGFDVLAPQVTYGPVRVDDTRRRAWLDAWSERLQGIATEAPIDIGRY